MISRSEARSRIRAAGGEALEERLDHLDATWSERCAVTPPAGLSAPDRGARPDYDVVLAGGGLSLLLAPLLAERGLSVAVFDRARVGGVHREWNAGRRELDALRESGLFSAADLDALIVARYARGVCRWHGGGAYPVTGVLDLAFDAGRLLGQARALAERRGVALFDGHTLLGHAAGPTAVNLRFDARDGRRREVTTRILVDARGAASPYATADLICPTVGGVVTGLTEGDADDLVRRDTGEILATTEGVEEGRQHLWEAFPGRAGEVTIYLFHYARAADVGRGALLDLFARFFQRLPTYKRGDARLLRPTFGYIPGWSRLGPAPAPPGPRVALVGDAAARHSPLTFCGFGASVRSLSASADALARAVESPRGVPGSIVGDAPVHAGTGALARLMAMPSPDPARAGELNDLLDVAFGTLHRMGGDAYASLLRDEMPPAELVRFLSIVAAARPRVFRDVLDALGVTSVSRWGLGLARELLRRADRPRLG